MSLQSPRGIRGLVRQMLARGKKTPANLAGQHDVHSNSSFDGSAVPGESGKAFGAQILVSEPPLT